jgi:hypothetical protein
MTFISNAVHFAGDANSGLTMSAGKLRGALRRLFAPDWTERWMIIVNGHAAGTVSRDAGGLTLSWFDPADSALTRIAPEAGASIAELHRDIARKLNLGPDRVVFLPIGE